MVDMISYQMKKKVATEQLNIRPRSAVVNRLETLAEKFKGDKVRKNEVAVEILEQYTDLWEAAEEFLTDLRHHQTDDLRKHGQLRSSVLPHGNAKLSPEKKGKKKDPQAAKK